MSLDYDLFVLDEKNDNSTIKEIRACVKDAIERLDERLKYLEKPTAADVVNGTPAGIEAVKVALEKSCQEQAALVEKAKQVMIRHKIKCLRCGDIIESKSQHDFKYCKCGSCYIDGGVVCPRVGGNKGDFEFLDDYMEVHEDN